MRSSLLLLLCCFSISLFGQHANTLASPQGFTTEELNFESIGITLAGTLFKPDHPYASVVLVHGSGQEPRMVRLASLLASKGIAVLTYDKRGAGNSGGVYAGPEVGTNNVDSANLDLLAVDASAAINTLLAHLPKNHGPLGLMGFSQAGWIIPLAAKKNPVVNFMILFSGSIVTAREQLRFQFYTQGDTKFWETHIEADARGHIHNDPDRYLFADTDPRDALGSLTIPGLWLFGGKDIQIPVGLSVERLRAMITLGKPYEYQFFPEFGHNTAFAKSQEPMDSAIRWIEANGKQR